MVRFHLVLLLVACSCFFSCYGQPSIGSTAKNISLPDVNGTDVSLNSLRGKIVLIDFWASWCRPCRQTVPGLKKLYISYHDKGFEIFGISLDENKTAWKTAISQDQSSWLQVNDNTGIVANQWYVSVIPTTFLLDRNGKIIAIDEEPKQLNRIISKLLK